jgi:hypothetical protein
MRDKYKYLALILGRKQRKAFMEDLATVRTKKLRGIVNSFAVNTARASALSVTFAEIAFRVRRDQWCMDYSIYKTEGNIPEPLSEFTPSPKCRGEFENQISKFASLTPEHLGELLSHWGAGYVNLMLQTTTGMEVTMDTLLSSTVIESWIAFETLAADLWVRAVDVGPTILRTRLQASRKLLTPDDNIGVAVLGEIDPQRKFGSSLREIGRVSFQRLDYIKRFYNIAFEHDFDKVFDAVDGGYIKALSAIRNTLIHNAGKADKTFKKQIQPFPKLRDIGINKPIRLDGESVKRLANVSHLLGAKLIHFVDDVLTTP